jgi:F0F1-type ATP synthase assembly protein I
MSGGKKDNFEKDNSEFEDEKTRAKKIIIKRKNKNDKFSVARAFALVTQLGLQMACCVVIGVLSGVFLDRLLGTMPVFIIIFAILGVAASFKIILDISKDWKD